MFPANTPDSLLGAMNECVVWLIKTSSGKLSASDPFVGVLLFGWNGDLSESLGFGWIRDQRKNKYI